MIELKKQKKYLRIFGIILFIYILSQINWPGLLKILKEANLFYILLSAPLTIPVIFIRTLKWKELVDSSGTKIPFWDLIPMFSKALFWGTITPGKLGEFYRAKYLTDYSSGIAPGGALYTVVSDRIMDLFSTAFIGILALFILIYIYGAEISLAIAISLIFLISGISLFLLKKHQGKVYLEFFLKIFAPDFLREKAGFFIDEFFEGMKKLDKILIIKLFFYDLTCFGFITLAHFFITISLGITIPFWYLYLITPLVSLVTILPISVLGMGTREVSYVFLLSLFGISLNAAVAFSFLVMFWSILLAVPGLIFLALKTN